MQSIQIIVDHPSKAFSGERTFRITKDSTKGFSASCPGFGSSLFFATPTLAVFDLLLVNGATEAVEKSPESICPSCGDTKRIDPGSREQFCHDCESIQQHELRCERESNLRKCQAHNNRWGINR